MTYMTHLNCPQCGYLIGEMTVGDAPRPAVDHTHVDDFLADRTVQDATVRTSSTDLRAAYLQWCSFHFWAPLTPTALGIALRKRQIPRARTKSDRLYVGIKLTA